MVKKTAFVLIALLLAIVECSADPTLPDPIAQWSGDSDAGDVTGNGWDAVLSGGATAGLVPGISAYAFSFDGSEGLASTQLILPSIGTISFWAQAASLSGPHGLFGTFGTANGDNRLWMAFTGSSGGPGVAPNRLVVNLGNRFVNDIDIPSPASIGEWLHIALTFDYLADEYLLYVNGILAGSSSAPRNAPTETTFFGGYLSDFSQNPRFDGLLDDVRVYDQALSAEQVASLPDSFEVSEPAVLVLLGVACFACLISARVRTAP